jgi:hypothetical protein
LGFLHDDRPEEYKYFYALDFLSSQVMNIPQTAGVKTDKGEVTDTHVPPASSDYHMQEILKKILPSLTAGSMINLRNKM